MRLNVASANPHPLSPSPVSGTTRLIPTPHRLTIPRSRSCGNIVKAHPIPSLRRTCSASYDNFNPSSEFSSPLTPPSTARDSSISHDLKPSSPIRTGATQSKPTSFCPSNADLLDPTLLGIRPETPDWPARDEVIRDTIARRASSVELPLSLRMLKKKKKMQQGSLDGDGEGSLDHGVHLCSAKRAFASSVYAIREIQSQALRMRGMALDEDMDGIIGKVQREMNASFVWLFREVFSSTPDLMVDTMVMMADFAAYSTGSLASAAAIKERDGIGRGGEIKETGNSAELIRYTGTVPHEREGKGKVVDRKEMELWNSMVGEEASSMMQEREKMLRDAGIGDGVMLQFVAPVEVEIEADDYVEYSRTDLLYQLGLAQEPNNTLLLSNYAQFLHLVARDYDRAEECFQRAVQLDSTDAETLSQYATFLWLIRKDLWKAEERYQQALEAEPDNSYHASKYANFLWSTGGDDTCYPA